VAAHDRIGRNEFSFFALTPPWPVEPAIAIAACRAGCTGILDLEYVDDIAVAEAAIARLATFAARGFGLKIDADRPEFFAQVEQSLPPELETVVLTGSDPGLVRQLMHRLQLRGIAVWLETSDVRDAERAEVLGATGIVAKGNEAPGRVGNETSFVLLQHLLTQTSLPILAHGGIGRHTAAACYQAGAKGVVLDDQLLLVRESAASDKIKMLIGAMDGSESVAIAGRDGAAFRLYQNQRFPALSNLKRVASEMFNTERTDGDFTWRAELRTRLASGAFDNVPVLVGQDAAFAGSFARRYETVAGVFDGLRDAIVTHCRAAAAARPLAEGSPWARRHRTRYPIVQGPMTRVSDNPAFALAVANAGALPFLALALMREPQVATLLRETREKLGERPWGVGILGFVPQELREEQLTAIREVRPLFALIAGGRPDQALQLEEAGIHTYLHVPSPRLLRSFIDLGARRFVFEGMECGGHVGPRSSFVLWESMVDELIDAMPADDLANTNVLFAGGIHDARSAAMVATVAAPLVERGVAIGTLLGSAYLFTREAVATGAITSEFQRQTLSCSRTALLESGAGQSTRCAVSPYVLAFAREKRKLEDAGASPDEIRESLEHLNLGRLRIATKGIAHAVGEAGLSGGFRQLDDREQTEQGLYMMGQIAALRNAPCSLDELHRDIAFGSTERLEALREYPSTARPSETAPAPCDLAIIGMACILPGCSDVESYWRNILQKVDAISEVPLDRWDWRTYFDPDRHAADRVYSKWGGFIEAVPFDPIEHGMPPNSLTSIEPIQLLSLEAVKQALKHAGYLRRPFPRDRTSVIFGVGGGLAELGNAYAVRAALPMLFEGLPEDVLRRLPEWTEDSFPGILLNIVAGRIANRFDLNGVNYTVDAACASSLAALALAAQELTQRTSDMVIVGGAEALQNPFAYLAFSKTQALSPSGRCRPFAETADGIVLSEGVAVVVLKRLADAERDGDHIYAVVKSVAGSSDGRDKSMTAPRPYGQSLALRRAYAKAGVAPSAVELVEAHGTGTPTGDEAELQTLIDVFADANAAPRSCALGSVKSMIGHTKTAAGLAGLIKIALALDRKVLPPTMNVERPNATAQRTDIPFFLNTEARPWLTTARDAPRTAGISAFGFGGTNFHAVLQEYRNDFLPSREAVMQEWPFELLLVAADSTRDLIAEVRTLEATLEHLSDAKLRDLAFTLWQRAATRRTVTVAIVASSVADFQKKLRSVSSALEKEVDIVDHVQTVYYVNKPLARGGTITFLFPGQGSQYPSMLAELAVHFPEVRQAFEVLDVALATQWTKPLSHFVFPPPWFNDAEERMRQTELTRTDIAQPALGAASMGLLRLLSSLGVQPDHLAGHSYGEYTALCAAGAFSEEVLYRISLSRGRALFEAGRSTAGSMTAVNADHETVRELVSKIDGIWISNINSPAQTVLSGREDAVREVIKIFAQHRIDARLIPVSCAFHSPMIAAARDRLSDILSTMEICTPQRPVYSNTSAVRYPDEPGEMISLLTEHLVKPVRFREEVETIYDAGARIFLEVGPRNVLTGLVGQILGDRPHLVVALDVPERPALRQLLQALGQLAAHGVPVSLDRLFQGRDTVALDLGAGGRSNARSEHAKSLWMVNGGSARPLSSPNGAKLRKAPPPVAMPASPPNDDRHEVVLRFQKLMEQFLETQQRVMSAYLVGSSQEEIPAIALNVDPSGLRNPNRSVANQHEPHQERQVPEPHVTAPAHADEDVLQTVLRLISEYTGYPTDLLNLDVALEADLGIASIKRTEIFATLQRTLALPDPDGSTAIAERFRKAKTIRNVIGVIESAIAGAAGCRDGVATAGLVSSIPRFVISSDVLIPPEPMQPIFNSGDVILITDDEGGIADHLACAIKTQGAHAIVVRGARSGSGTELEDNRVDLHNFANVSAAVEHFRATHGTITSIVHMLPLAAEKGANEQRTSASLERAGHDVKSLFYLVKAAATDLGDPLVAERARILAVVPELAEASVGGIAGFLKSLALEWTHARHKSVSISTSATAATITEQLMTELNANDNKVEIAYKKTARFVPRTTLSNLNRHAQPRIKIDEKDVILITGGARGITAEIARELALRYRPHLILVGRSPLPEADEAPETAPLVSSAELKAALKRRLSGNGESANIGVIEATYKRLRQDREIRNTLAALTTAGSTIEYIQQDVRDEAGMSNLLERVYRAHGKITGVVHGAGIIDDRLIAEKTTASFNEVFDTKVRSAELLVRMLRPEQLKFLALFSSIAGVFGNRGQCDYAAANAVLNALAQVLDRVWKARVVAFNWGPWDVTGMVSDEVKQQLLSSGIILINPVAGRRAFVDELEFGAKGDAAVVVGDGPWAQAAHLTSAAAGG
jgi:acyl transferase domain-containing protein/NAD(P)H-dependent flavin oxidoreductase YrpB (nitropropane dioxygenase family)/NADP-dependent 3-hydroxy acid dehydrogenase YdfG